jgi:hypothetical protein
VKRGLIWPLDASRHDRARFDCGVESLDPTSRRARPKTLSKQRKVPLLAPIKLAPTPADTRPLVGNLARRNRQEEPLSAPTVA